MLGHRVNQAELEAKARHEQLGLVAGFAFEGHRVAAGQFCAKPLADQSDLRRTNSVYRLKDKDDQHQHHDANHEIPQKHERRRALEHIPSLDPD